MARIRPGDQSGEGKPCVETGETLAGRVGRWTLSAPGILSVGVGCGFGRWGVRADGQA